MSAEGSANPTILGSFNNTIFPSGDNSILELLLIELLSIDNPSVIVKLLVIIISSVLVVPEISNSCVGNVLKIPILLFLPSI